MDKELRIRIVPSIADVAAGAWDACAAEVALCCAGEFWFADACALPCDVEPCADCNADCAPVGIWPSAPAVRGLIVL